MAINSQQALSVIDVFTLKIVRTMTIGSFNNETTAPSHIHQIRKDLILIGSLAKSAPKSNSQGVPTIDLLHCNLEEETPLIVFRSIPMPCHQKYAEYCTPVFKSLHLIEKYSRCIAFRSNNFKVIFYSSLTVKLIIFMLLTLLMVFYFYLNPT